MGDDLDPGGDIAHEIDTLHRRVSFIDGSEPEMDTRTSELPAPPSSHLLAPPSPSNALSLRRRRRTSNPMFPDLAPDDCDVSSDMPLAYLMLITVLFFFPSVRVIDLLAVDKSRRTPGDLTKLQKDMDRLSSAAPLIQVIFGVWFTYLFYMYGNDASKVVAQQLADLLLPLFCNPRYCIV